MRVDTVAQAAFVALSGDANPLHTDPLAARRLPFGRAAVHGVHLALIAIDRWAAATGATPGRVRATFRQPVGVDDDFVDDIVIGVDGSTVRLTVDGRLVADVRIEAGERAPDTRVLDDGGLAPPAAIGAPVEHRLDDLRGLSGELTPAGDPAAIAARFAHVPIDFTALLLAITRLVGMEVPGLHSMLASFDVAVRGPVGPVRYRVADVDERFSKVVLTLESATVQGTVTAFVRPAPTEQVVDTAAVAAGEFAAVRALVVGGSRGLGAAAVQLLAAGGADVRFTYHRGAADAAAVAARSPGATAHPLDATDTAGVATGLDALLADGWRPTLLAWFASPPIFVGARGHDSPELRERFRAVYVGAFTAAVDRLDVDALRSVLWPSSEAVDAAVPGLAEYADAKREGEAVCAELATRHRHLTVDVTRFPRLRTDQTASFVPVDADDPAPHVLAALRRAVAAPQR